MDRLQKREEYINFHGAWGLKESGPVVTLKEKNCSLLRIINFTFSKIMIFG